jgi:hypothetical protein
MIFQIKKGKHRARPLYWLKWWPLLFNPAIIQRRVIFDFSAKYDLKGPDQADHNKLFGVAFGNVHYNSARFGWRYDIDKNVFILSAYCYLNGTLIMSDLCEVFASKRYDCQIFLHGEKYLFRVVKLDYINGGREVLAEETISKGHKREWCLFLGLYFGGNKTAPHNMTVNISKIKAPKR